MSPGGKRTSGGEQLPGRTEHQAADSLATAASAENMQTLSLVNTGHTPCTP
jgi:hypothetical protein